MATQRTGAADGLRGDVLPRGVDAQGEGGAGEDGRLRAVGFHGVLRGPRVGRAAHRVSPTALGRSHLALPHCGCHLCEGTQEGPRGEPGRARGGRGERRGPP